VLTIVNLRKFSRDVAASIFTISVTIRDAIYQAS